MSRILFASLFCFSRRSRCRSRTVIRSDRAAKSYLVQVPMHRNSFWLSGIYSDGANGT